MLKDSLAIHSAIHQQNTTALPRTSKHCLRLHRQGAQRYEAGPLFDADGSAAELDRGGPALA